MLAVVLLLVISALIVKNIHEDERVVEVKAKYKKLREHLINTHEEDFKKTRGDFRAVIVIEL